MRFDINAISVKRTGLVTLFFAVMLFQPACVVAGYSSDGGWFFFPGGILGLIVIIVLIFLFMRKRR